MWLHVHVIALMRVTCDHPDLFHLCLVLLPFLVYLSLSSSCSVVELLRAQLVLFVFPFLDISGLLCLVFVFPVSHCIKLCFWTSDCLTCEETHK